MSDPIRVIVSGSGKMGRAILDALESADDVTPVGVVDGLASDQSLTLTSGTVMPMTADPGHAFRSWRADVVIDFTNAAWTPTVADAAPGR